MGITSITIETFVDRLPETRRQFLRRWLLVEYWDIETGLRGFVHPQRQVRLGA